MTKIAEPHIDRAREVREGEVLDLEALHGYLHHRLTDHVGPLAENFAVEQFPSGHSNLTYLIRTRDADGEPHDLVLRRPPFGTKVKTAHDMGREFRVLSGLMEQYPLVPRTLLHCTDEDVIGAPFYVMERVRGVILRSNPAAEKLGLDQSSMRQLCERLVDGLSELHAVDLEAAGLADFGKPEGYVERQIKGWTRRYYDAQTDELMPVDEVAGWLGENLPADSGAALIHGDYKYDNLVLDPADPTRVIAILDWEMATVGDPLMDLGTTLGYWVDPADPEENKLLPVGPTLMPGNLDRRQLAERYAQVSGRDPGNALFYYVYGLFKVAVIAQQIYYRFKHGHTQDPRFAMMIMGVDILGKQAARALDRDRIHDLG